MTTMRRASAAPDKLLEAALELIVEVGWDAVTTRLLADRAGVGPGLVHYHFSSVPALLRGAAFGAIDQALTEAIDRMASCADVSAGLDVLADRIDRPPPDRLAVLFVEALCAAHRDPALRSALLTRLGAFRADLEGWLAGRGAPQPRRTAAVLATTIDGMLVRRAVFGGRARSGERAQLHRVLGDRDCA